MKLTYIAYLLSILLAAVVPVFSQAVYKHYRPGDVVRAADFNQVVERLDKIEARLQALEKPPTVTDGETTGCLTQMQFNRQDLLNH